MKKSLIFTVISITKCFSSEVIFILCLLCVCLLFLLLWLFSYFLKFHCLLEHTAKTENMTNLRKYRAFWTSNKLRDHLKRYITVCLFTNTSKPSSFLVSSAALADRCYRWPFGKHPPTQMKHAECAALYTASWWWTQPNGFAWQESSHNSNQESS